MSPNKFNPEGFKTIADILMGAQPTEAAIRTAVSRVYYSVYLIALYHFFPNGTIPRRLIRKNQQGSHAIIINQVTALNWALGNKLFTLHQLRIQADYRLIPDQQYSAWANNWQQAHLLETEIRNTFTKHGIAFH